MEKILLENCSNVLEKSNDSSCILDTFQNCIFFKIVIFEMQQNVTSAAYVIPE